MLSLRFPQLSASWPAALAAAMLWAVAVGSLLLWWLHMPRPAEPPAVLASLGQTSGHAQAHGVVERALGHTGSAVAAPDVQKRFVLLGVVASPSGQGSALIALDNQPAQVYTQGQAIEQGWALQAVFPDAVTLRSPSGKEKIPLRNSK